MKCTKCHISVKPYFAYCPNCGAKLHTRGRPYIRLIFFVLAASLVFAIVGYEVFFRYGDQPVQGPEYDKPVNDVKPRPPERSSFSKLLFESPKPAAPAVRLSVGMVVIYDIAGNPVSNLPAAMSESGWIAIPARLCVGGYSWYVHAPDGAEHEIVGGILGDQDDIGIWQSGTPGRISGPAISSANPDQSMTWMSIVSEKSAELSGQRILSDQQNVYHITLPDFINEPGVIFQDRKIVGWAFGDLTGGGYLWKGPDESGLVYELSVSDFYRLTFENSREEQFIIAYAQDDQRPVIQLETFAEGFRRESMLFDDTTPDYLKPGAVITKIRSIMSTMTDQGNFRGILSVFDSRVLAAIGDVSFVLDVLMLGNQINGPEYAIDVTEGMLADPENFDEDQILKIRQLRKDLYQQRLTLLMNQGDYATGLSLYRQVAESFGNDPEIHLLGVKLALVFNDWQTAEEILYAHRFPIHLTDQVRILESQIAELKFQEDKIVVRFTPGSGRIPVPGKLNNRLQQDFFIDTGASMVTIPSAAAAKLGIKVDGATPVRELVTAGGMVEAPQITLNSIELGGWVEYNVTAYILDMPDQSGVGLLGLNYLNRFRMDLNSKAGVLTLAPR